MELGDIDPRFLAERGIRVLGLEDERLIVAMPEPADADTVAALAFAARRPVVTQLAEGGVVPGVVARSLAGGIAARVADAVRGAAVARWVLADALARLVADGASWEVALARMVPADVDGLSRTGKPVEWADAVGDAADPAVTLAAVARRMRAEIDLALAVRRAAALPVILPIVAVMLTGVWGAVLMLALTGFHGVPAVMRAARLTGRAVARGDGPFGHPALTPAERDRLVASDDVAARMAVADAVDDRARLMLSAATTGVSAVMLLATAILILLRID